MAEGKTVCVTGATGFIASWLVKLLLERDYTVRGTVRNPDTAPRPSYKRTLNVLESCVKAKGLKRVVLTFSIGAVAYNPKRTPDSVLDESFWSDCDYTRDYKLWYELSKTLAEKAAWDFAKQHDLDMVVINPSVVFGPLLQNYLSISNEIALNILNGKTKVFPNWVIGQVGVKDVAMAHILVYENPVAEGRYICSERVTKFSEFVSLLAKLHPEYHIEAKQADGPPDVPPYKLSSEKIKKLGLTYQLVEDVIHETVTCFRDLNLLP